MIIAEKEYSMLSTLSESLGNYGKILIFIYRVNSIVLIIFLI